MQFILYSSYAWKDIETIVGLKDPHWQVTGAFYGHDDLVVALARFSHPNKTFTLPSPTKLSWAPHPSLIDSRTGRLPDEFERSFAAESTSKLLFASTDGLTYTFIGNLDLSTVALINDTEPSVMFRLSPKLPRDLWEVFGSYGGWKLTINGMIQRTGNHEVLMAAMAECEELPVIDAYLTRYEEDEMHLVANGDAAFVTYTSEDARVLLASRNERAGADQEIVPFSGFHHSDWEMSADAVVSRTEAVSLLFAFLKSGQPKGLFPAAP